MPLRSHLLHGDLRLEAAAVSDPAHITPGATGEYVRKIQLALGLLDGAIIEPDGKYGPKTANAVLYYKQKRGIINRAYQLKADNVVGKMTIAAMDAELLQLEQDLSKRPRIRAVTPQAAPIHRSSLMSGINRTGAPGRKTKSFFDQPKINLPGDLVGAMELKLNGFGSFQVIDGRGSIVRCWDSSVGELSDPSEPQAHTGDIRVKNNQQTFRVLGRGVGRTFIEARRSLQTFPNGDLLSLVVVAHSDKLTWRPRWTPRVTGTMSSNPWASQAFGPIAVPGMMVKAPLFEFTGSVDPDSTISRHEYEVGILQTMFTAKMEAVYVDANNQPTWTCIVSCSKTPMRDSADDSPLWYHKDDVKSLSAANETSVKANDSPQIVVPWQTKDKKGILISTSGIDVFCTWLAVREKSTGKLTALNYAAWSVNWGCNFNFKTNGRIITGFGALNSQGEGQGPLTPITAGKPAIEETTMTWTGPPGGY